MTSHPERRKQPGVAVFGVEPDHREGGMVSMTGSCNDSCYFFSCKDVSLRWKAIGNPSWIPLREALHAALALLLHLAPPAIAQKFDFANRSAVFFAQDDTRT